MLNKIFSGKHQNVWPFTLKAGQAFILKQGDFRRKVLYRVMASLC